MKKLYVYADFDWLKEMELIGELGYESLRGADSYSFTFNNEWLRQHSNLFLSDDLNNYPGQQYTQPDKDIFGCFSDALPDRWGRTLLLRREQIAAAEEKRPIRRLSSFDFLTGIDDFSRMGGFRFKEDLDGEFINVSESLKIPPLTDIRELIAASAEIEKCEENNMLPDRKWIAQLVQPGTSLGGARPKANVIDTDKTLYVAKFPSRKDDYDAGLWEHFSHLLATKAGINASKTKVLATGEKIVKTDVSVAKNYLREKELEEMGRIVNASLDMAESMAMRHIPMTMEDWAKRIDKFINLFESPTLQDSGKVSAEYAKEFAESEFEKYRIIQDRLFQSDFDRFENNSLPALDIE